MKHARTPINRRRPSPRIDISHETVKWHVHNLSLKLEANTRRHAVDRARMLGPLGP